MEILNFCIGKIFGDVRGFETAVFAILGLWSLLKLGKFQPSKSAKLHEKSKLRASKYIKFPDFALLESPKIDFT